MALDIFPLGLGAGQTYQIKKTSVVLPADRNTTTISCPPSFAWSLGKPENVVEVAEEREEENNSSRKGLNFDHVIPTITSVPTVFCHRIGSPYAGNGIFFHPVKSYLFLKVFRI
jgi:hypothetical protein